MEYEELTPELVSRLTPTEAQEYYRRLDELLNMVRNQMQLLLPKMENPPRPSDECPQCERKGRLNYRKNGTFWCGACGYSSGVP